MDRHGQVVKPAKDHARDNRNMALPSNRREPGAGKQGRRDEDQAHAGWNQAHAGTETQCQDEEHRGGQQQVGPQWPHAYAITVLEIVQGGCQDLDAGKFAAHRRSQGVVESGRGRADDDYLAFELIGRTLALLAPEICIDLKKRYHAEGAGRATPGKHQRGLSARCGES